MRYNIRHLTLLASRLPFAALAGTFNVSPLPLSPYADTEVTTNVAINAQRFDVKEFGLNISFEAASSNNIQVAFGRDFKI